MIMYRIVVINLVFLSLLGMGCASKQELSPMEASHVSGEVVSAPSTGELVVDAEEVFFEEEGFEDYNTPMLDSDDPWEGWNRFWFGVNDVLYLDIFDPIYAGYEMITPSSFRVGLSNAAHNILMPVRFLNAILQGEFAGAGIEVGKFLVNSFVGFGGLADVTKENELFVPYESKKSRFGTTLAIWGVAEGPYVVWPFFGPSTLRQTVGLGVDILASPFSWVGYTDVMNVWVSYAIGYGMEFNNLNTMLDNYETITKSAVEPYIAVREAYLSLIRARLQKKEDAGGIAYDE